jgi:predicted Zn-dependent protease
LRAPSRASRSLRANEAQVRNIEREFIKLVRSTQGSDLRSVRDAGKQIESKLTGPNKLKFRVVEDRSINASATKTGDVRITTGLIRAANNDPKVAAATVAQKLGIHHQHITGDPILRRMVARYAARRTDAQIKTVKGHIARHGQGDLADKAAASASRARAVASKARARGGGGGGGSSSGGRRSSGRRSSSKARAGARGRSPSRGAIRR